MVLDKKYVFIILILHSVYLKADNNTSIIETKNIYCFHKDCFNQYKDSNFLSGYYKFHFISDQDTFLHHEGLIDNHLKQGVWKYYYRNTEVWMEIFLIDDTVAGTVIKRFESGKLESIGNYSGNKAIGLHITYYENGCIKEQINYSINGEKEGLQRSYYSTGKIKHEEIYPISGRNVLFTNNRCGNNTIDLEFMLDGNEIYHGNEWYESGQKKVECYQLLTQPSILKVIKFDTLGNIEYKGQIVYEKRGFNFCWFKTGKWFYFDRIGNCILIKDW